MDDYIAKPIRNTDLASALSRWLPATADAAVHRGAGPESAPGSSPIDRQVLGVFRDESQADGDGFLAELIGSFLAEAPLRIAGARQAVAKVDAAALRMAAHSLKGSSSTLGANNLASLCSSLEARAKSGSVDKTASELIGQVESEFERVREALEAELGS